MRKVRGSIRVVLFGSYARGDCVADPIGGYFSDFDMLVVVNHEELTEIDEYWYGAEDRLLRELEAGGPIRTQSISSSTAWPT